MGCGGQPGGTLWTIRTTSSCFKIEEDPSGHRKGAQEGGRDLLCNPGCFHLEGLEWSRASGRYPQHWLSACTLGERLASGYSVKDRL